MDICSLTKNWEDNRMNQAILATKPNHKNVKELLKQSFNNNDDNTKKVRIYDDPGELIRYQNYQKRMQTNQRFNDEYFSKFHTKPV